MPAPTLKLYTYEGGTRALKAQVAAKYCDVTLECPPMEMGKTNKTPEFLKMNPNGKVPTLEVEGGQGIWESNAIARYVARLNAASGLYGSSALETAHVDQWMDWCLTTLESPISQWVYGILGYMPYNKGVETKAKGDTKAHLEMLNAHLLHRTFLVGEKVTLADIVIVCTLILPYQMVFDAKYRADFPNVTRWFLTVANQPEFIACHKLAPLCEKMAVFVPKKEPKPEAKAAEPKAAELEEEAAPKKVKNPLDDLPPTPMVLDEWKRAYSNYKEPNFYGVMEQFYKLYDAAGWSLWLCDYMYDEDNTVGFKTCNLVEGFVQRSDALRRYAFGNMVILQKPEGGLLLVRGAWLMRGHEIAPMLEANPDSEYFKWTKVDLANEEHKKILEDRWCASEKIGDLIVKDTNTFK